MCMLKAGACPENPSEALSVSLTLSFDPTASGYNYSILRNPDGNFHRLGTKWQ